MHHGLRLCPHIALAADGGTSVCLSIDVDDHDIARIAERVAESLGADLRHIETRFGLRQALHVGREHAAYHACRVAHQQHFIELSAGAGQQATVATTHKSKQQQQQSTSETHCAMGDTLHGMVRFLF